MGDRGNAIVIDGKSKVFLYTHWGGSALPDTIRNALIRGKGRWNDGSYLARIIFCEMVKGDEMGETGFGISSERGDGGNDITIDVDKQTVNGIKFKDYIDPTSYAIFKKELEDVGEGY